MQPHPYVSLCKWQIMSDWTLIQDIITVYHNYMSCLWSHYQKQQPDHFQTLLCVSEQARQRWYTKLWHILLFLSEHIQSLSSLLQLFLVMFCLQHVIIKACSQSSVLLLLREKRHLAVTERCPWCWIKQRLSEFIHLLHKCYLLCPVCPLPETDHIASIIWNNYLK